MVWQQRLRTIACFVIASSVAAFSPAQQSGFHPANQPEITYSNRSVRVTLITHDGHHSLSVSSADVHGDYSYSIDLPDELAQVDAIRGVVGNKIAVSGLVNGAVAEIVVANLQTRLIEDKFVGYKPAISPDGRYVAFVKFYPPHFVSGESDHYMLYDFRKDARDNRPAHHPVTDFKNVGLGVYPPGAGNADYDNTGRPHDQEHRLASTALFWSPDSKNLIFLDAVGDKYTLVDADVSISSATAVRSYPLLRSDLCAASDRKCMLFLEDIRFKSPQTTLTVVVKAGSAITKTLDISYSQFE